MVQLHVATELQLDYTTDQPFQLPKASVSTSSVDGQKASRRQQRTRSSTDGQDAGDKAQKVRTDPGPIPPTYPGSTTAMNPQLAVVVDRDGLLSIFYDTFYAAGPFLGQETIPPPWPAGRNPQGRYGIKAARHPETGNVHLVYAYRIWPTKTLAHIELGTARFPMWRTTDCVNQNFIPGFGPASAIFDIGAFDVGFDVSGVPLVAVTTAQPPPGGYSPSGNFFWYPATNQVTYFDLDIGVSLQGNYDSLTYGGYPSPPQRMSPDRGVIVHALQTSGPDTITRLLPNTSGATIETVTQAAHTGVFRSLAWCFLEDPSTAPLGFVLDDNSAYFIWNSSGGNNPLPSDNLREIFNDLPPGRHPLQIGGVAVAPDATDDELPSSGDSLDVHAFGLFGCADNTFELWHTRSVPNGVVQVSDGVLDIPLGNWSKSVCLTKDIYCVADGMTSWLDVPFFTALIVGKEPTCFVESESTDWAKTVITGQQVGMARQVREEKIYYVDITVLDDNLSALPGTAAVIGADSPLVLTCAGRPHYVDSTHTFDAAFNSAGKLGISLPANETLIPSSFWIRAEGMDEGARVDVQPGPNGMHDTFQNLGVGKNPDLREARDQNGNLVVPADTPDAVVASAQTALQTLSKVITGCSSSATLEQEAASTAARRHVAPSTPLTVARTRAAGEGASRFRRLRPIPGLAFAIRFSGDKSPEFVILTKEQAVARKAAIRARCDVVLGPSNGFWDDVGDFFSDVGTAVVSVVEVVVDAAVDAYEATIHFVEDQINKALDAVIEFASQAAAVASMVFDWVKTTFETLYYWLAFIFDFKDIKATADVFETYIKSAGPNLQVFIDNTVKVATEDAFQKVRGEIEGFFDAMIAHFGTQTVSNFSPPVPVAIKAINDPRVRQLAVLKGKAGDVDSAMSMDGLSDLLTLMPSSASWLLEKILGHITESDEPEPLDAGVVAFGNALTRIKTNFTSVLMGPDFKAALDALVSFAESIVSPAILSGEPIAALLRLFKSFALIVLDLMHTVLDGLLEVFRFAAVALDQIFNAAVDNPAIQAIYWAVTGGDTLSWESLCAFVMAIPHTILYKIIMGKAPYPSSATGGMGLGDENDDLHMANGIFNLLKPFFLGCKYASEIADSPPASGGEGWFALLVRRMGEFYNGVISAIRGFVPVQDAAGLLSGIPNSTSTPADIAADILVMLRFIGTLTDTLGSYYIRKNKLGGDTMDDFRMVTVSLTFLAGGFGAIATAIAFLETGGNIGTRDQELLVGNIVSIMESAMDLTSLAKLTPDQKGYVWLIRSSFCFTSGSLFIAAAQASNVEKAKEVESEERGEAEVQQIRVAEVD
ncbi:hypothetical protein EHS25_004726 [Saitozyma podzolica]|uniref:Uncharacterized protein n=1 Tax=Saitozyma podzolica TaxID=1890683 RepID=A0A427Y2M2_9TREE|nr:hypothetical protein EHS25_004726 [Saitozyma podzolica]